MVRGSPHNSVWTEVIFMHVKPRVTCGCGKAITANTLASHLRFKACKAGIEYRELATKVLSLTRQFKFAWLSSEGIGAKLIPFWGTKVLNGDLSLDELTFVRPRKRGVMTPEGARKISRERMGTGNPGSSPNPYGVEIISKEIKSFCDIFLANKVFWTLGLISACTEHLDQLLPKWSIGLCYKDNHERTLSKFRIVSYLLKHRFPEIYASRIVVRGHLISIGQRASPSFIEMAQKSAIKNGARRTTKTQIRLYELVLQYDPDAVLEHEINYKLFDIYSPAFNVLIEMHGYVWHDIDMCPPSLRTAVISNMRNDAVKAEIAKNKGYRLWVFWDYHEKTWREQLENYKAQL